MQIGERHLSWWQVFINNNNIIIIINTTTIIILPRLKACMTIPRTQFTSESCCAPMWLSIGAPLGVGNECSLEMSRSPSTSPMLSLPRSSASSSQFPKSKVCQDGGAVQRASLLPVWFHRESSEEQFLMTPTHQEAYTRWETQTAAAISPICCSTTRWPSSLLQINFSGLYGR